MTTANVLYLLLAIGTFAGFSVVLAYVSWQETRMKTGKVVAAHAGTEDETSITSHA
jgi:hypothetical protein